MASLSKEAIDASENTSRCGNMALIMAALEQAQNVEAVV